MKFYVWSFLFSLALAAVDINRLPLEYAAVPNATYVPSKNSSVTTVLDFIRSRSDLSVLGEYLAESAGFTQAFDTDPNWSFTFFAPSNEAFNNTSSYFSTYHDTPKGKFWFGNLMMHHYVPNSALKVSAFNETESRLQTGSYLYVGARIVNGELSLNHGAATVTQADLVVAGGIVHIVDHLLDPAAMIFEAEELPKVAQGFIPGSCSNPDLPYC